MRYFPFVLLWFLLPSCHDLKPVSFNCISSKSDEREENDKYGEGQNFSCLRLISQLNQINTLGDHFYCLNLKESRKKRRTRTQNSYGNSWSTESNRLMLTRQFCGHIRRGERGGQNRKAKKRRWRRSDFLGRWHIRIPWHQKQEQTCWCVCVYSWNKPTKCTDYKAVRPSFFFLSL